MIADLLSHVSLFAELTRADLESLASFAVVRTFKKNVIVINEGDSATALYVILSGRVKVFASDEDGREVLLNFLGPEEFFGELSLIDGEPRSASVITLEPSKVAILARNDLINVINTSPAMALSLLQTVGGKLRRQTESTKSLALQGVYQRLAKVLSELVVEQDGQQLIEGVSHQQLADRAFSSREMVTLVLRELKQGGYIDTKRKAITIKKRLPDNW